MAKLGRAINSMNDKGLRLCRLYRKLYLGIKGRVLNAAVDEEPKVVLDHEGLHIGILVLLVDLLNQSPSAQRQGQGQSAVRLLVMDAQCSSLCDLVQDVRDVGAPLVGADRVHKADLREAWGGRVTDQGAFGKRLKINPHVEQGSEGGEGEQWGFHVTSNLTAHKSDPLIMHPQITCWNCPSVVLMQTSHRSPNFS